jgi:hypothetical protein
LGILDRIGLVKMMKRFATSFSFGDNGCKEGIDIRHPISVWGEWTALKEATFGYLYDTTTDGKTRCVLVAEQEIVAEVEAFGAGKILEEALKIACTERAIAKLKCRARL